MSDEIDQDLADELAAADAVRPDSFDYAIRIRGLVNRFGDAVIHDGWTSTCGRARFWAWSADRGPASRC